MFRDTDEVHVEAVAAVHGDCMDPPVPTTAPDRAEGWGIQSQLAALEESQDRLIS